MRYHLHCVLYFITIFYFFFCLHCIEMSFESLILCVNFRITYLTQDFDDSFILCDRKFYQSCFVCFCFQLDVKSSEPLDHPGIQLFHPEKFGCLYLAQTSLFACGFTSSGSSIDKILTTTTPGKVFF